MRGEAVVRWTAEQQASLETSTSEDHRQNNIEQMRKSATTIEGMKHRQMYITKQRQIAPQMVDTDIDMVDIKIDKRDIRQTHVAQTSTSENHEQNNIGENRKSN